jgi:gamma-glutamyltranspeptidase
LAEKERQMISDFTTGPDITYNGPQLDHVEGTGGTHICVLATNGDAVSATSSINFK